jgi:predicted Zn-dependent peptidase
VEHDEAQTEFRLNFLTVPEQHEDHAALQIIRRVLDDGLSARLPFNVVEKRGLAYSVHAGIEAFHDVGVFEVEGASAPEKASQVVEEVCRTLAEICDHGVTADELSRAQRRHRMFLDFAQDSPGDLAGWFGGTELFRPPESFEERVRQAEALTLEQVRQVARRYFTRANLGVVAVGQKKGAKALERAAMESPLPSMAEPE